MVFPLAAVAVTSPLLWRRGRVYRAATRAQVVFYGLGASGLLLRGTRAGRRKVFVLPAFFCFVNAASLRAVWNVVSGHRIDRWEPQRPPPTGDEDALPSLRGRPTSPGGDG
jgi:hypothetical protein